MRLLQEGKGTSMWIRRAGAGAADAFSLGLHVKDVVLPRPCGLKGPVDGEHDTHEREHDHLRPRARIRPPESVAISSDSRRETYPEDDEAEARGGGGAEVRGRVEIVVLERERARDDLCGTRGSGLRDKPPAAVW